MGKLSKSVSDNRRGNLDALICTIRHETGSEAKWERQANSFVDKHPYICGYAFLIMMAVFFSIAHLTVFAISMLFLYFISDFMTRDVHKIAPFIPRVFLFLVLYVLVISFIFLISYRVVPQLAKNFPEISSKIQGQIVHELKSTSERWNLSQYVDVDQVREIAQQANSRIFHFLLDSLTPIYKGIVQFLFALVINLLLYFEYDTVEQTFARNPDSLMSFLYRFLKVRLRIFYAFFRRVMGGQVIISLINTAISSVVIFSLGLPHPFMMLFIVFFCGLFPVIGNLISNTVLTLNAFVSTGIWGSVICVILLISVHKLEYFLNSKIIGGIVHLPMTVSLAALVLCESFFGIPGLILAIPLVLFFRHEFEHIPGYKGEFADPDAMAQPEFSKKAAIDECTEDAARLAQEAEATVK